MSHEEHSLKQVQKEWPQTLGHYVIGFSGSVVLTCISFFLAAKKLFSMPALISILIGLALVQAFTQLIYFMHFGKDAKPRWMTIAFWFMTLVVLIIVLLSLWIIFDLDNRTMSM